MNNNVTSAVLDVEISIDSDSIIRNLEDGIKREVYNVLSENYIIDQDIYIEQFCIHSIAIYPESKTVKVTLDIFDEDDNEEMLNVNVTLNI